MFIHVGGGGGTKTAEHVYKMAPVVSSPTETLSSFKVGFRSFRSIVDQNTLLNSSARNTKCAQECSSGKK